MKAYAQFTITKINDGSDGTPAKLIRLVADSTVFTSVVNKEVVNDAGEVTDYAETITPTTIKLTAQTQSVLFDVFTYSLDGITWNSVINGEHGFALSGNELTIACDCDLFNSGKTVTIKASSNDVDVIDTLTIVKTYDSSQLASDIGNIDSITKMNIAEINKRIDGIDTYVSEKVVLKNDEEYQLTIVNEVKQSIGFDSIQEDFSKRIEKVEGGVKSIEEVTNSIKRSAEGIEIFATDSDTSTLTAKDGFHVKVKGEDVALFTEDKIDVKNAVHDESMTVGKVQTKAISDDSIIDIWVGG